MKHIIKKTLSSLSIMALSLIAGEAFAYNDVATPQFSFPESSHSALAVQQAPKAAAEAGTRSVLTFGYCNDYPGETIRVMEAVSESRAAIKVPKEQLAKYKGIQIDSIKVYLYETGGFGMQGYIRSDLDGSNLVTTRTSNYGEGWNTLKFSKPYVVTGDTDLYFCYSILFSADDFPDDMSICITYDEIYTPFVPGRSFYSVNNNSWYSMDGSCPRNIMIRAYASGEDITVNDVALFEFSSQYNYIKKNAPMEYYINVRNNGTVPVTSLDLTLRNGGKKLYSGKVEGLNIPNNGIQKIALQNMPVDDEGNCTILASIDKVNGEDDTDNSDNSASTKIYSYRADRGLYGDHKKVLFEQVAKESATGTWIGDSLNNEALSFWSEETVWIRHHRSDKFHCTESDDIMENYLFGDDGNDMWEGDKPFTPAIAVDRYRFEVDPEHEFGVFHLVSNDEFIKSIIGYTYNRPCAMLLDLATTYDPATRQLVATVNGLTSANQLPDEKEVRLVALLVEDGLESTDTYDYHTGGTLPSYTYNNVVRHYLSTDCWGDKISYPDAQFSKEYTYTVPEEYNADKMRVVVFAYNYMGAKKYVNDGEVYNAAQAPLNHTSGVESVAASVADVKAWAENGKVVTAADAAVRGVYDFSGKQVRNEALNAGIYVARVADANGAVKACKVVVK